MRAGSQGWGSTDIFLSIQIDSVPSWSFSLSPDTLRLKQAHVLWWHIVSLMNSHPSWGRKDRCFLAWSVREALREAILHLMDHSLLNLMIQRVWIILFVWCCHCCDLTCLKKMQLQILRIYLILSIRSCLSTKLFSKRKLLSKKCYCYIICGYIPHVLLLQDSPQVLPHKHLF